MFPPVLVIHLNRFKNLDGKKVKNNDPILYNEVEIFGKNEYRLIAAIIHEGSIDAGHYWSICLRENQYYVFNDSKVSKI
jgi:ubiquitin C-terminal hydrolase